MIKFRKNKKKLKGLAKIFLVFILVTSWLFTGYPSLGIGFSFPPRIRTAYATATVTPATGGGSISADTTGGSYTTLTGPTITEGANKDVGLGTIVLSVPSGFIYNTGATVTATITRIQGSKTCFTFSSLSATPTASTITFTVTAQDGSGGNPATTCYVTFSNIQVRPSSGTPLASGNITHTGTASIVGVNGTNFGTLTEVAGAKNKLTITQQPSATANVNTDFATKPIVAVQDQFGNTLTSDSSTTVSRTAVLSTQACGGTSGSGTLSSTPASGAAVSLGLMTYTAMQYSAAESIKICFTSSGITSALSNTITVSAPSPTFTQNDFRFYQDQATVTLTNLWGIISGDNQHIMVIPATSNPPGPGDKVRLQINITVGTADLTATTQAFKLQYKTGTDKDCSTGSWTDIGAKSGTTTAWRLYDNTSLGDTTTEVNQISTSDVAGGYSELVTSGTNPNAVSVGLDFEWDWPIESYLGQVSDATSYSFRMVKSDGTAISYSAAGDCPTIETKPGTANLMRHGEVFFEGLEKGFFWAN